MRRSIVLFLLAAGCGGEPHPVVRPTECDRTVLGACVVGAAPNLDTKYLERQMRLSLAYWNEPEGALEGWAIVFSRDTVPCPTAPASGCTWWDSSKTIELHALDPDCLEASMLVHEIGHAVHHDRRHTGPWWNWTKEQQQTWEIVRSPDASPGCRASRYYMSRP
jgi:hypothetical protein